MSAEDEMYERNVHRLSRTIEMHFQTHMSYVMEYNHEELDVWAAFIPSAVASANLAPTRSECLMNFSVQFATH